MIIYKALSKQEFADDAGIQPSKLRQWLKDTQDQLDTVGLGKEAKILPPAAVRILAEKYQVFPHNAIIK